MAGRCFLAKEHLGFSILLGLSTLTGCGATDDRSASVQRVPGDEAVAPNPGRDPAGTVRLALLQPSGDTNMAALEGVLLVEGSCLYVTGTEERGRRTMPAFSFSDVRWDANAGLLKAGDVNIYGGQRVRLTGGTPPDMAALEWVQRPDPSCDASDLFVTGVIEPIPNSPVR